MKILKRISFLLLSLIMVMVLNSCFFANHRDARFGYYKEFDQYENQYIYDFLQWDKNQAYRNYLIIDPKDYSFKIVEESYIEEEKIESGLKTNNVYTLWDTGVFDNFSDNQPEIIKEKILKIYDEYCYDQKEDRRYFESLIIEYENRYDGYLNIYKKTGKLSRGHGLYVEDVYQSIYFSFTKTKEDIFLYPLKDSTIVSFYQDWVIYFKNSKYYSHHIHNQETICLFEDIALNHGISSQSHTSIYFNQQFVLFDMEYAPTFGYSKTQLWFANFDGTIVYNVFSNFH